MSLIRQIRQVIALAALLLIAAHGHAAPATAQEPRGPIYTAEVEGTITSVTIAYLRRAVRLAEAADAQVLIITVSSGGGVLRDIRPFAGEIAMARVPIVVYVAPEGTQSGAAGALFLSAAHISALAPRTTFGSPDPLTRVDAALTEQTRNLVLDSVADQIRRWNAERGRNTTWVDRAVREGVVLNNEQAIAMDPPAVDLVAADQQDLLTRIEGRVVTLADGRAVQLATLGRRPTAVEPTLWESLRLALADPTIAFVLLVLGALAIYLEFAAPGTTLFAGIGVVLLAGAAAGLLVLPIQWWALLLLLFSLGLIGAEFFVPTHGGLTVTGLALMIVGAFNLIDPSQAPGTLISVWVVALVALAIISFAAFGIWLALHNRTRPVATGTEALVGRMAQVRRRLDPEGMVFIEGALWQALSEDGAVESGDWVRVTSVHELRLIVRRIDTETET